MYRLINILLIAVLFVFSMQCRSHRSAIPQVSSSEEKFNWDAIYNNDSTYCAYREKVVSFDGRPPKFFVLNVENSDTVYVGLSAYQLLKWESVYTLKLRRIKGIQEKKNPYSLKDSNNSIYYLNIVDLKLSGSESLKK